MLANRILNAVLFVLEAIVLPLSLLTTPLLGLMASLTAELFLLPFIVIWFVTLLGPLLVLSWFCHKIPVFRNFVGILFIPWAVLANTFVCLLPARGRLESRAAKLMLCNTWPFTWEFWQFQHHKINLYSSRSPQVIALGKVIERIAQNDPIMKRVVARINNRQNFDFNL